MAQQISKVNKTELQPLVAQVRRFMWKWDWTTWEFLLVQTDKQTLEKAMNETEASQQMRLPDILFEQLLDFYCLFDVYINPESRVKGCSGPCRAGSRNKAGVPSW
jgi:hypothetical protein